MPRDEIEVKAFLDELVNIVTQMPIVFLNSKNSIQTSFNTMIAYRDDPDTPTEYIDLIQNKIDAGKTIIQTMLNNLT